MSIYILTNFPDFICVIHQNALLCPLLQITTAYDIMSLSILDWSNKTNGAFS